MASQYATWLTHLALADGIGPDCIIVGGDILGVPLLRSKSGAMFRTVGVSRQIVPIEGGGRFYLDSHTPDSALPETGPVVLLADGLTRDQIDQVIDALGRAPTVIFQLADKTVVPGYQPAAAILPGLFVASGRTPDADAFVNSLIKIAMRHCEPGNDGFDALGDICDHSPLLHRVQFHAEGDAMIDLVPLALVRELDRDIGQQLVLSGTVHLQRWRPVILRVPVFGLRDSEIQFSFSGDAGALTVTCQRVGRGGLSVMGGLNSANDRLTVKLTGSPRTWADLVLTGHDTSVEAVAVRLPALSRQDQDPEIDPLDRYSDPLSRYGEAAS